MSEVLLRIDNLSVAFGGVKAVRDVSFDVHRGEIVALIGPNGAGKTSVFNLVSRVFDAEGGKVLLEQLDLLRVPRHEVIRHGVSRTFQNIELFEGATVLQNLLLGRHSAAKLGFLSQWFQLPSCRAAEVENRERVEDMIEFLDLARWRQNLVAGLSYGTRKIIELGRALVSQPRLLLLDEPASGLNYEESMRLGRWIREIRDRLGVSVLMVEHDMSLVSAVADAVIAMDQGLVLAIGSASEVQNDPRVVAAYLGR
jgi:branched-chain amino acid transport system ATP-binding protein